MIRDFLRDAEKYGLLDENRSALHLHEALVFENHMNDNLPLSDEEIQYIISLAKQVESPSESWAVISDGLESNPNALFFDGFLLLDQTKLEITYFDSFREAVYENVSFIKSFSNLSPDVDFKQESDKFIQIAISKNISFEEFLFLIDIAGNENISNLSKNELKNKSDDFNDKISKKYTESYAYGNGFSNIGYKA